MLQTDKNVVSPEALQNAASAQDSEKAVREVLDFLLRSSTDIETCLLVTHDGFMIAWAGEDLRERAEGAGIASADLFARCDAMARQMREGRLEQVVLKRDSQLVVIQSVNQITELVVLCKPECSLGLALTETEYAASRLSGLLV